MKVYARPLDSFDAGDRMADRLEAYTDAEVVPYEDAELVVLHVTNYAETEAAIRQLITRKQLYALLMYRLRSTERPNTKDWLMFWQMSECVWSPYDLEALLTSDYQQAADDWFFPAFHASLGTQEETVEEETVDLDWEPIVRRFWEVAGVS